MLGTPTNRVGVAVPLDGWLPGQGQVAVWPFPELLSHAVSFPRGLEAGFGVLGRRPPLGQGEPLQRPQEARQHLNLFTQEDASWSLGRNREPPSPGVAAKHRVRSPGECGEAGKQDTRIRHPPPSPCPEVSSPPQMLPGAGPACFPSCSVGTLSPGSGWAPAMGIGVTSASALRESQRRGGGRNGR